MGTVRAGSLDDLQQKGQLLTKLGSTPVVVFWHDDRAWAIEDRCPHMGFPLHRGSVECGLVTCHWHHARFDLESGGTLDLWADDARAFDVEVDGGEVVVHERDSGDRVAHLRQRLQEGLEDNLTLVIAKSVLGLVAAGAEPGEIVGVGVEFGTRNRAAGWGSGLTVLVAMANLLPHIDPADRALALVHGLTFLAGDVRGNPPRFATSPLSTDEVPAERLDTWYRRFIETRSAEAAERVLATSLRSLDLREVEAMMFAAVTDHVFIDGGHTLDFTNKAFEALDHIGVDRAPTVLPCLVPGTAQASRAEESNSWQYPDDLAALAARAIDELTATLDDEGSTFESSATEEGAGQDTAFDDVEGLGRRLLDDDPGAVVAAVVDAARAGAAPEQLGRAVGYAAALRLVRFHTQNEIGDWDTVHHTFTAANALHQALERAPTPELLRGVVHLALKVYLDRFLNVPAARLPTVDAGEPAADLADLERCWEVQGAVDEAGGVVYGYLRGGGDRAKLVASLSAAVLREDADFHWYQIVEAGVRQASCWPDGSDEQALVLAGVTRFLAAHTPTRRAQTTTFGIAQRLGRGEALFEEE